MSGTSVKQDMPGGEQDAVIAAMGSPGFYPSAPRGVSRYETHGALVFAAGAEAYKIKRAVRFPYMDFSTLALREAAIRREFELNKALAPCLYKGVVAVVRDAGGALRLGGDGEVVEWALHMRRFEDRDLLSSIAESGRLDRRLGAGVAEAVAAAHSAALAVVVPDGAGRLARVAVEVASGLAAERETFAVADVAEFRHGVLGAVAAVRELLDARGRSGAVRRCHGDLHLGNIVVLDVRPVLFDALDFSEELATIDVLYDLAFLVMDMDARGLRVQANGVLGGYLLRARPEDVDALAALPLFLALRAGIRAMVTAERAAQEDGARRAQDIARARGYLGRALDYLKPRKAALVAVGGFSGTGKSMLAGVLAAEIGRAPGALVIRADAERKALFGVAQEDRLPPDSYTPGAAERVYAAMMDKARRALTAGHSAVVDAVFLRPEERAAAERVATTAGVAFQGLWLTAPRDVLMARVASRRGDASDATVDVVERQLARGAGVTGWPEVAAGGRPEETAAGARNVLQAAGIGG